jgi:hypothetical protein
MADPNQSVLGYSSLIGNIWLDDSVILSSELDNIPLSTLSLVDFIACG